MFVDIAKILVKAGNGGNGAVAFRREKYEPSGGPYGGDGGNGGNIILEVDEGLHTLMDFKYKRSYKANNGENGRTKKQYGKRGKDLVLKVPQGTIVKDADSGRIIADLNKKDQRYIVAKGGKGGKGNAKFATSTRQAPRFAESGEKGEEKWIILELKLLADVGLVGFPNVGKSTLLSILSAAKPKIDNYPFTTLVPNLGVVRVDEGESFVLADIPGLIEGAHEGAGLGYDFLRHVERTKVLVHVIDISGQEGRNPIEDFYKINEELKKFNERLSKKPQVVVANKMDLPDSSDWFDLLRKKIEPMGYEIIPISAATGDGVKNLKFKIWEKLQTVDDNIDFVETVENYEEETKKDDIIIKKENGKYIVEGDFVERLLYSINFDDIDSVRYFQNMLGKKGIVDELRRLGVEENETVYICGYEFEFFE
jgi:GTP-binding protein